MIIVYLNQILRTLRMNAINFVLSVLFVIFGCSDVQKKTEDTEATISGQTSQNQIQPMEIAKYNNIAAIPVPDGYKRIEVAQNSFGEYLRKLELKQTDNVVYYYNGQKSKNQSAHFAIIKMDVGTQDLQQCADAVMRLRGEYLFQKNDFGAIHFNFTNGDKVDFLKYASGYRAAINGSKVNWTKKATADTTYKTFRSYMDLIFMYAGSHSLEKELIPVTNSNEIQPGDVFIHGGFPGHAVTVIDVAIDEKTGERIFMLSQSFMPAQEIHILKSFDDFSPWYSTNFTKILETPSWTFERTDLKRFMD